MFAGAWLPLAGTLYREFEQRLKVVSDVEFVAASINVVVRQWRSSRGAHLLTNAGG